MSSGHSEAPSGGQNIEHPDSDVALPKLVYNAQVVKII